MALEKTWRWFGPSDPVTLDDLVQMGVEGVVTSLHYIPKGQVWDKEEILKTKKTIEAAGLRWSVVESLPVSESIKLRSEASPQFIENYKTSLRNLGECGIDTVCYNFMPLLDWSRTNLAYTLPGGAESLLFDFATFAAFDIYMLERPGAEKDYSTEILEKAEKISRGISKAEADDLIYKIIVLTQGFIDNSLVSSAEPDPRLRFRELLALYNNVGKNELRENLAFFLQHIVPVAEEFGVMLAIHPDDPPFSILGLPRIVSTLSDLEWITEAYPSVHNGITYCVGSLSARKDNDLTAIARLLGHRIHFVHLRNTQLLADGSFYESGHLRGSQNMAILVTELLLEQRRRISEGRKDVRMPFRPDHGLKILHDFNTKYNPGYPLIGRLKGLAEIDGLMAGIESMLECCSDNTFCTELKPAS